MYRVLGYDDTDSWTELETFGSLQLARSYAIETIQRFPGWFACIVKKGRQTVFDTDEWLDTRGDL